MGHGKGRCPDYNGWMLNHACYGCEPDIATGSADGYHNAHPDVAFASYSFRNAVRFAKILGVDTEMAATWQAALDAMPEYPKADFQFVAGETGEEYNGGGYCASPGSARRPCESNPRPEVPGSFS